MTVKNHKEAECATASGDDMDFDNGLLENTPIYQVEHEENLLGRVLAGKKCCIILCASDVIWILIIFVYVLEKKETFSLVFTFVFDSV